MWRFTYTLGIIFQSSGSFKLNNNNLLDKASKAAFAFRRLVRNDLAPNLLLRIFDTLLKPKLTFCSAVTWKNEMDLTEAFYLIWLRFVHTQRRSSG